VGGRGIDEERRARRAVAPAGWRAPVADHRQQPGARGQAPEHARIDLADLAGTTLDQVRILIELVPEGAYRRFIAALVYTAMRVALLVAESRLAEGDRARLPALMLLLSGRMPRIDMTLGL
jgi:hypothetical protein